MPTPEELLAAAQKPTAEALRLHPFYRGKVQIAPKCAVRGFDDFAIWYTPGVAAACKAIQAQPELVYEHTNRANTVAIVSDGTRVLGLGDIGPEAGLPVMEGKALLFKYLGGIDAVPLCVATRSADELVRTVEALQPSFGGINLEDISQPKCFDVLDRLRASATIPVWHDDQQGTALVTLAALLNALRVVEKSRRNARVALIGFSAANVAVYRLLVSQGFSPQAIVVVDRQGILHRGRRDIEERQHEFRDKWRVCCASNGEQRTGDIAAALVGADACIAFSKPGPGTLRPEWLQRMNRRSIVFATANPVPEIWPWEAREAGVEVFATGRSDFPNQVNNSLGFPAVFRGALDVRARAITDSMALAAARELADCAGKSLSPQRIVPRMDEWELYPRVAVATALAAQAEGVAQRCRSSEELYASAERQIGAARRMTEVLMSEGLIAEPPGG